MHGIPPVLDTDAEDVAWALQTADALWKRNEHVDAIVWLRRAAQAAGDAGADDRAVMLAREAAELAEWLAGAREQTPMPAPSSMSPTSGGGLDDLSRASAADADEVETPTVQPTGAEEPLPAFPLDTAASPAGDDAPTPLVPPVAPADLPLPSFPLEEQSEEPQSSELKSAEIMSAEMTQKILQSVRPAAPPAVAAAPPAPAAAPSEPPIDPPPPPEEPAPAAADVHAGMLDPWADDPKSVSVATSVDGIPGMPARGRAASQFEEDEIVTSARPLAAPGAHSPHESPTKQYAKLDEAPAQASAPKPPPLPPRPAAQKPPLPKPAPPAAAPKSPSPPPPRHASAAPAPRPAAPGRRVSVRPPGPAQILVADGRLDLSGVEALADLPDEEREAFAGKASVTALAREQEVSGFALALVLEGDVDVAATVIDAPAVRVAAGAVLRSRGTIEEGVPIRLVCASDSAKVATWNDDAVNTAFSTCPWVEDDLRAAADRIQALVGITVGPLGERLDPALRGQVTSRLELRSLAGGEIIVQKGQPVPGMFIVGVGELEVLEGDAVQRVIMCGEFLFPEAILGAGPAPAVARAGAGGALVLFGSRALAQELLVTCPPLLEVFAGM
jgi:hypothetical protein